MQTSVEEYQEKGLEGLLISSGNQNIQTGVNNSKQNETITVTAEDLATTVKVNGDTYAANVAVDTKTTT